MKKRKNVLEQVVHTRTLTGGMCKAVRPGANRYLLRVRLDPISVGTKLKVIERFCARRRRISRHENNAAVRRGAGLCSECFRPGAGRVAFRIRLRSAGGLGGDAVSR